MLVLGRYRSGQPGQTVNLLAFAFVGSNPTRPTLIFMPLINPDKIGTDLIKIFLVEFLVLALVIIAILAV